LFISSFIKINECPTPVGPSEHPIGTDGTIPYILGEQFIDLKI